MVNETVLHPGLVFVKQNLNNLSAAHHSFPVTATESLPPWAWPTGGQKAQYYADGLRGNAGLFTQWARRWLIKYPWRRHLFAPTAAFRRKSTAASRGKCETPVEIPTHVIRTGHPAGRLASLLPGFHPDPISPANPFCGCRFPCCPGCPISEDCSATNLNLPSLRQIMISYS